MQCKDVSTDVILRFLAERQGLWSNWYFGDENDVSQVFPKEVSRKLVLAKMKKLYDQGLIGGCVCGCRGDFEITDKGLNRLGIKRTSRYTGY